MLSFFPLDGLDEIWDVIESVLRDFLPTLLHVQSTLVILKSKGPAATLRDIRTSTYQICRIEDNTNRTTKFHKSTCNLTSLVRNMCS